jgi:amino acid adenylation domain-containing protein
MTQVPERLADAVSLDGVPAGFAQRQMWLVSQQEQHTTAQNVLVPLRLTGRLDVAALTAAVTELVRRHAVLRTTFRFDGDELVQVVREPGPVAVPVIDLSEAGDEQDDRVHDVFGDLEATPFDLAVDPVLRARLVRLADDDHVLVLCVHHIAIDAESVPLVHQELAAAYNAEVRGGANELPEPVAQYTDYATWQLQERDGPARHARLEHWRQQLAGLSTLDLPTDRPVPSEPSGAAGFLELPLDPDHVAALADLADGATVVDGLQAVLTLLLSRYSGQDDVAVGTTASVRDRAELNRLVGYFQNTLVLRTDLTGEPTFRELVARTAAVRRAALANAALPFDAVVAELAGDRAVNRSPFFRVYFGHDSDGGAPPDFDGLAVEAMLPEFSTARFDLSVKVVTAGTDATLYLVYSEDLYDEATMRRLLGHYATLLADVVARPDEPAHLATMLTPAELHDILVTWNDTAGEFPDQSCLHELIEQAVDRNPDAVAVIAGDDRVTYGELDARANRLAHRLRALGVTSETLVGTCLHRSAQYAVAVLAVLKAGGGYLPLDPDYPTDRLEFMISDAKVWGVLTQQDILPRLAGTTRLVDLDTEDTTTEPDSRPAPVAGPDNVAYVIYTSGSTGRPKGIVLRHQGALNNFVDINSRYGVGPGDALFAISSPSFDMSVYDLLGTLMAGATVVMPGSDETKEPARWTELVQQHNVTVWHSVPALLDLVLDHVSRQQDATLPLRQAIMSGDWIPVTLPERVWTYAPNCVFAAQGGSTEASMDSVHYPVTEVPPEWTSIPYGFPMRNQKAWVLDRNMRPQPIGVPGEFHLGGVGVARGYLHRPELTADRFVEHTFPDGRTERIYKTGDLARYRPDGSTELLGRMDFQVKVHGLRIELGEIETAMVRHPAVAEACVVARGERGDLTLAGFVRLEPGTTHDEAGLKDWLRETLPVHMVPTTIMALEKFPISPNGKVDRTALSAIRPVAAAGGGAAPADELEERIAAIWRDVLGVEELGVDEDFFSRGGDSFAAVRAMLAMDSPVPVVELFKNPTVRAIAERIRAAGTEPARVLHELRPAGPRTEATLVCVPYGGGNAMGYQPLAEALSDRFALWAVTLPGYEPTDTDVEFLPFDESVAQCAAEVLERISGPVVVYGHCMGTVLAADLARRLEEAGADVRAVYLAAHLPVQDPAESLRAEQVTSDEEWAGYLTSIGGFDGALDWSTVEHMMRAGRNDHIGSMNFLLRAYAEPPRRITAPVHCVYGDADPATEGFAERHTDWLHFAESLDVSVIPGGNHYFVRNNATELAELIDRQIERGT